MNRLDEYLKLPYTLVLIPDLEEGGFTAYFPELKGCVTCGETYTEAVENAMDAKKEPVVNRNFFNNHNEH